MKIYILPYTMKTFFDSKKRVSGVDIAAMAQFLALKSDGHKVRLYTPFGNVHYNMEDIDFYRDNVSDLSVIRDVIKEERKSIYEDMVKKIIAFKPDIIYSNFEYSNIYARLQRLDIPIIYNSHATPGFFADLNYANELAEFLKNGNSLICVSKYHANRTNMFYTKKRKKWEFDKVVVDDFLYPQYTEKVDVNTSDGVVRHVSAASREKSTFLLPKMLKDRNIPCEIFTTNQYLGFRDETYFEEGIALYGNSVRLDVPHDKIMKQVSKASSMFVGLATYDTFTITSLEALSRGIPLILKGNKYGHPAKEMVSDEYSKFVTIYSDKNDFIDILHRYDRMTLDERKSLANDVQQRFSKQTYLNKINVILENAIKKHSKEQNNIMEFFQ